MSNSIWAVHLTRDESNRSWVRYFSDKQEAEKLYRRKILKQASHPPLYSIKPLPEDVLDKLTNIELLCLIDNHVHKANRNSSHECVFEIKMYNVYDRIDK